MHQNKEFKQDIILGTKNYFSDIPDGSLGSYLKQIKDPRQKRGQRFSLLSLLSIIIWGFMSGMTSMREIADKAARIDQKQNGCISLPLKLRHGTPGHATLSRIMTLLDPLALAEAFTAWTNAQIQESGFHLAIDGKALRARTDKAGGKRHPPYILNVVDTRSGKVIASADIGDKRSEITMVPRIIEELNERFPGFFQGMTISTDALSCQTKTFAAAQQAGADFTCPVKKNSKTLLDYIQTFMFDLIGQAFQEGENPNPKALHPARDRLMGFSTVDRGHGRLERRTYYAVILEEDERIPGYEWITTLALVKRERRELRRDGKDKVSTALTFYQHTAPLDLTEFESDIRSHWSCETAHFYLDVDMGEDFSTTKKGAAPFVCSWLRKAALNLLMNEKTEEKPFSLKSRQNHYTYNPEKVFDLIFQAPSSA